jgi:hypothetical protein
MTTTRGKTWLPSEALTPNWDAAASNEQGMRRAAELETRTDSNDNGGKISKAGPEGTLNATGGVKPA